MTIMVVSFVAMLSLLLRSEFFKFSDAEICPCLKQIFLWEWGLWQFKALVVLAIYLDTYRLERLITDY